MVKCSLKIFIYFGLGISAPSLVMEIFIFKAYKDLNLAFLHAGCKRFAAACQRKEQTLSGGDWGLGVHLQFTREHSLQSLHFRSPPLSAAYRPVLFGAVFFF